MKRHRWVRDVTVVKTSGEPIDVRGVVGVELHPAAWRLECLDGSVVWFTTEAVELLAEAQWRRIRVGRLIDGRWVPWELSRPAAKRT